MFFLLPALVRLAVPTALVGGTGYLIGRASKPTPCTHAQQTTTYCGHCGAKLGG